MKIIDKFQEKINRVLSTFDRMILKGYLQQFFSTSGKMYFLSQENVLLKDFGDYAENTTDTLKKHIPDLIHYLRRRKKYSLELWTEATILMDLQMHL